jgi:SH3 domain-containing YSC84-like protein 1
LKSANSGQIGVVSFPRAVVELAAPNSSLLRRPFTREAIMRLSMPIVLIAAVLVLLADATPASAQIFQQQPAYVNPQSQETAIVESSTNVLNEIMAIPAQGIPRALLHDAQGIAIVPSLLKGGFVIGVKHGRGVVVLRDENGNWRAPSFITITGGSIGWQAGVQSTDVVLVFKTKNSVRGFTSGKFTIGADVAAAAGPVGREASASTDASLRAEMYSYSRSRGLFAGAALDGSVISLDNEATAIFYRGTGILPGDGPAVQQPVLPTAAVKLLETIAMYAGDGPLPTIAPTSAVVPTPGAVTMSNGPNIAAANQNLLPADLRAIQSQLAQSSQKLAPLLDANWQRYLALPVEVYNPQQLAASQQIDTALDRFSKVASDPKYRALAQRAEFQETLGLLKSYHDLQAAANPTIALPPPPN